MKKNMVWIEGRCKARHINHSGDFCNKPVVSGGEYCVHDTCIIKGCKEQATTWYPMLSGEPRFCSKHYSPKYASKYGCDFSGPDDFDIPDY